MFPHRPPRLHLAPLALAAAVILGAQIPATALAQPGHSIRLAAQPLGDALNELARQAGLQLLVRRELVAGKQAPALSGQLTARQALDRLLAGSGLEAVIDGASVIVQAASAPPNLATLPTVRASAPAWSGVSQNLALTLTGGALGGLSQRETPFSSAVISSEQIQEQAVQKLGDLFVQDASVSDNSGAYTAWSTYLTVRGMDLDWQNSYRIDGKPYLGYTVNLPYEHMEQVELLKGATGFMYGFGAPGGMLNYVTKKPPRTPLRNLSLSLVGSGIVRINGDLGGRLGADGALGYRLDATHERGRTANEGSLERSSMLLALDARLSDRLSWDFQAIYQDRLSEDTEPGIATRAMGNVLPAAVLNDEKLVGPGNYVDNRFGFVTTGLKYRLSEDWQASTSLSSSHSKTRRNESILYLQNAAGDYIDARADYGERYKYQHWDAMLQGRVRAAGISHHLVAGLSWQQQSNDDSRNAVWISNHGSGRLGQQNTNRYDSIGPFDSLGLYRLTEVTHKSAFASDRIELDARWSAIAGLRWMHYQKPNWNSAGALSSDYRKSGIVTPTLALMYKPAADTQAYASYVESLQQGATVPSDPIYSNARAMLDPLVSKQWELGLKRDGRRWSATAALFRVTRPSEFDRSCGSNCLTKVQSGESVFQGLELGATVEPDKAWRLGASLMLLDAEYGAGDAAITGRRVVGAPDRVATAQLAYRVPQLSGLQLRLDVKHTGRTPLRADNSVDVDGYTLAMLGATYDTQLSGQELTLRATLHNLFNHRYWMYQYSNYIKAGDPRSLHLGATLRF